MGARGGKGVYAIVRQHGGMFNIVNCATAFSRLARAGVIKETHEMFSSLCSATLRQVGKGQTRPRHVSGILWSLAKLGVEPQPFVETFLKYAETMKISTFQAQEISMCLWAMGKLQCRNARLEQSLAVAVGRKLREFTSQGLSNVVYSFAALDAEACDPPLLHKIVSRLCAIFKTFNAQEVANTLSSLAKLGLMRALGNDTGTYSQFQRAAEAAVRHRAKDFSPQNLANAMWSIAKYQDEPTASSARVAPWAFKSLFAALILDRSVEFNCQEISMCTWAAAIGMRDEDGVRPLVESIGSRIAALADSLNGQQIPTILTGLAKLKCENKDLVKMLAKQARKVAEGLTFKDLDQCLGSFARLGYARPKFTKAAIAAASAILNAATDRSSVEIAPQNVSNLMWALAKLDYGPLPDSFCSPVEAYVIFNIGAFGARDIGNIAWAFAMLKVCPAAMRVISDKAAIRLGSFNAQECSKLLYAMEKSKSMTAALRQAASQSRTETYNFPAIPATVRLAHILGGGRQFSSTRESTGATAATGNALWEPSLALAEWLSRQSTPSFIAAGRPFFQRRGPAAEKWKSWNGKVVVELGAGIGLCSVVAAKMGMEVVSTDGDSHVLSMLAENVRENGVAQTVGVKQLEWGQKKVLKTLGLDQAPDVVLASGCVYGKDDAVFRLLVKSLRKLSGPDTLVIMSHGNGAAPGVQEGAGAFQSIAEKKYDWSIVPLSELHPDHTGCRIHLMWRK